MRFRDWSELDSTGRAQLRVLLVDRARALEPSLNAYVATRTAMERPAAGPLGGMPYAAKDIFAASDRRPQAGMSKPQPVAGDHAAALSLLDAAGGIRLGYTGLTEVCYEPSGYNSVHGRVRNPWNLEFISGGSSSGSAAAVAGGSVVIALGSDTGGSLRIPAHCCGVTAWKPTYGVVPAQGSVPLAPALDTIGLLARRAADLIPGMAALASGLPDTPVRRAVVMRDALASAHPAVRRACQDGIDAVAATGIALDHRDGTELIAAADVPVLAIMQAEAARCHRHLLDDPATDPILRKRLGKGLDIDDVTLAGHIGQRPALAAAFIEQVLGPADVALLPVTSIRTPSAAECDPASPTFSARTLYELSRLTRFVNMIGLPAVAIPVGFDDRGLPVALQAIGRPRTDTALLRLAAAVQDRTDWHGRVPAAVAPLVTDGSPDIRSRTRT
jgi:aspartyl-tRNA(Asn)/glutamyl-tRNA(Gln) amidotransferase subunit A